MRNAAAAADGFSLVEVLIAATTVVVALCGLAQLLSLAAAATRQAHTLTVAAVLAHEKLETLIPRAALDPAVSTSPATSLTENIGGYCDFLDPAGTVVGGGSTAPADAAYVRRWAIDAVPTAESVAYVLQVIVADARRGGVGAHAVSVVRHVP